MTKDIEERKKLTFEQAEGIEPLPSQLKLREVSQKLRAVLWHEVHSYLDAATEHPDYNIAYFDKPWSTILKEEHIYRQHRMADDFENNAAKLTQQTRVFLKLETTRAFSGGWNLCSSIQHARRVSHEISMAPCGTVGLLTGSSKER